MSSLAGHDSAEINSLIWMYLAVLFASASLRVVWRIIVAMCGTFIICMYDEVLDIVHRIEVGPHDHLLPDWPARPVSAHPGVAAPIITARFDTACPERIGEGSLEARELIWGYEAPWAPRQLVFNTRLDGAAKPLWCDSMLHRRCLIPCRSFFETSDAETVSSPKTGRPIKQRYKFGLSDGGSMLIGGIWQNDRFSMITTEPNVDMAPIHHRMPLIVRPNEVRLWFGPDFQTLADRSAVRLEVLSETYPGQQLTLGDL